MPDAPAQPYAPYGGSNSFAAQLKKETAAVRLSFSKFGVRRSLARDQVAQAARVFSAQADTVSAAKRILNSKDPAWVAVTSPIGKARLFWKTMSVPFPTKGVRLLRRDLIEMFDATMTKFAAELHAAKQSLDERYAALRLEAQSRLGRLFDEADYPDSVTADFSLEWDYPSVDPPDYLKELNPALYEQERRRLESRFAEAAALTENAFAAELSELVAHLADRLTPDEGGKKKRLNKKALEGFKEFFDRFQSIRIGSGGQIDQLVAQARELMAGVNPEALRAEGGGGATIGDSLRNGMTALRAQLDTLIVEQPKRRILLEEDDE